MNKKTITTIILSIMLIGLVSAFTLPPIPPIDLFGEDEHINNMYGRDIVKIYYNEPFREDMIFGDCNIFAEDGLYYLNYGKSDCYIPMQTHKDYFVAYITWDYSTEFTEKPKGFTLFYDVRSENQQKYGNKEIIIE